MEGVLAVALVVLPFLLERYVSPRTWPLFATVCAFAALAFLVTCSPVVGLLSTMPKAGAVTTVIVLGGLALGGIYSGGCFFVVGGVAHERT